MVNLTNIMVEALIYADVPLQVSNLATGIWSGIEEHFKSRKDLLPFQLRIIPIGSLYQAEFSSAIIGIACKCNLNFPQSNQRGEKLSTYRNEHLIDCINKIQAQLNRNF
jgi:hypothetical protein